MLSYIEFLGESLGIPVTILIVVVIIFLCVQGIGELLEFKGKVVPEFVKIRKYFRRKKNERKKIAQALTALNDMTTTLKDVKQLLSEVDAHYSADNITKRDAWMQWVNDRANVYDKSIGEIGEISKDLTDVTQALKNCTKMTEEMFVENSRDRIIDFAEKVVNPNHIVSHEQFRRIFRVYDDYESWLEEHEKTNGEVDIAYQIIKESYEEHMKNHTFIEDVRCYGV